MQSTVVKINALYVVFFSMFFVPINFSKVFQIDIKEQRCIEYQTDLHSMGHFYAIDSPTDVCTSWKNASGNSTFSNIPL